MSTPTEQAEAAPSTPTTPESFEDISSLLYSGGVTDETPAETTAETTEEEEQPEERQAEDEEQAKAATTTEEPARPEAAKPKDDDELAERFRFKDPIDRAIATLRKADPTLTWAEAERRVKGEPKVTKEPEQQQPTQIEQLRARKAELAQQIDEAAKDETLFNADIAALNREFAEVTADLKLAERDEANRQNTERATHQERVVQQQLEQRNENMRAVIEEYPSINDKGSDLNIEANEVLKEWSNPNHPKYDLTNRTDTPELVAQEAVKRQVHKLVQTGLSKSDALAKLIAPKTTEEPKAKPAAKAPTKPAPKVAPARGSQTQALPTQAVKVSDLNDFNSIDKLLYPNRAARIGG